jgi:hypothetical protein
VFDCFCDLFSVFVDMHETLYKKYSENVFNMFIFCVCVRVRVRACLYGTSDVFSNLFVGKRVLCLIG